jgi:hypothetical protein
MNQIILYGYAASLTSLLYFYIQNPNAQYFMGQFISQNFSFLPEKDYTYCAFFLLAWFAIFWPVAALVLLQRKQ